MLTYERVLPKWLVLRSLAPLRMDALQCAILVNNTCTATCCDTHGQVLREGEASVGCQMMRAMQVNVSCACTLQTCICGKRSEDDSKFKHARCRPCSGVAAQIRDQNCLGVVEVTVCLGWRWLASTQRLLSFCMARRNAQM